MKLKLDANGNPVLKDGHPVYIHDDGTEMAIDVGALHRSASARAEQSQRVEAENKTLKEAAKAFEGITDAAAARKALEIVKNLDDKKLVDAGEVEKIKSEAIKAVRAEFDPIVAERDGLRTSLYSEMIGGSFSRSKLIADKFAIPSDLVQARFGQNFKVEDGKTVAYDMQGQKIYSRARPGELADFDEALGTLVDAYPHKAHILKGSNASGGGSGGNGGGGGGGGGQQMTRAQFAALSPADQMAQAGKVQIVAS